MTANSLKIVNFLKGNYGTKMTAHQIADALEVSLPTVTGSVNGLVKKGYAIREEVEVPGEGDKTVKVKYISLTEDGHCRRLSGTRRHRQGGHRHRRHQRYPRCRGSR